MTTDSATIDSLDFPTPAYAVADEVADLLFREARTIGAFTDQPVSDDELAAVYDLLKWGPTAMNTSPLRLLVVRSDEGKARLAAHAAEGNRDRILAAPLTLVVAADPAFHRLLPVLAPHRASMVDALEAQPEQRAGMARQNTLIQTGYLITALRATGLDAGPIGGVDTTGIDAEFFAESGWQSQLVVLVGHRDGVGTPHPRAARLAWSDVSATV
ncbi:MAG: malonic semialdehyde reductase [Cellulomonas sp.]|uniref:Nitroreductase family protein n=1 Tax=Cellulomonas gelida TaxID=1712 RepID=A0A4Y3KKK4_9CELL|nr:MULTISPECIES: malonic semialdehyde reductase [Cellulomonas]MCR6648250.1 malonic semialdehyde reductase [Cellulomonas sp.]MCR6704188.1 malonic semialdehyde reductase [Cellulomonas sp.]GEA83645.1 nitroreductase family protein [Cellulomonas gelida]GGL22522.1 nitroreductase family protein [Cellulomonas gelida]